MNDNDLLPAFPAGTLSAAHCRHRDHPRVARLLVRQEGINAVSGTVASGSRLITAGHGQTAKDHEALTQFRVRLVGHMVQVRPDIGAFDAFLTAFPRVLDRRLPARH
jgi:hypothetical protein